MDQRYGEYSLPDQEYFARRKGVSPYAKTSLPLLRRMFLSVFKRLRDDYYFQEALGYRCIDQGNVYGTWGKDREAFVFSKLKMEKLWPIEKHIDSWDEAQLFTMIEFLYDHVSARRQGTYHVYADCGWHGTTWDQEAGRRKYREEVNGILRGYAPGYVLSDEGEIMELTPQGLEILRTPALRSILPNEDLKSGRAKQTGLVVSRGQQFEGFEKVLEIMSSAIGNVIVVDPYPGDDTLAAIGRCPAGVPVQFLTCPPLKESERAGFEALARRLMSDRHEIQIRYAPEGVLHDRFISSQNGTWLLGHSIKDVGKKLSTINPASKETAETLREKALALWKESKSLEQTSQSWKRSGT